MAFPVGALIDIHQLGAGQVGLAGSLIVRSLYNAYKSAGQYGVLRLRKRGPNDWQLTGNTTV